MVCAFTIFKSALIIYEFACKWFIVKALLICCFILEIFEWLLDRLYRWIITANSSQLFHAVTLCLWARITNDAWVIIIRGNLHVIILSVNGHWIVEIAWFLLGVSFQHQLNWIITIISFWEGNTLLTSCMDSWKSEQNGNAISYHLWF